MKSCRGCAHYVKSYGLCNWYGHHGSYVTRKSEFDGKERTYFRSAEAPRDLTFGGFSPLIDEMRKVGGPCGPDAVMREPGILEMLFGPRL